MMLVTLAKYRARKGCWSLCIREESECRLCESRSLRINNERDLMMLMQDLVNYVTGVSWQQEAREPDAHPRGVLRASS